MSKFGENLIYRITQIMIRLYNNEKLNEKDLAYEFSVSLKTIQRDVRQRLGILPIIRQRNGVFYLQDTMFLRNSKQNLEKFASIFGLNSIPTKLSDEFISMILYSRQSPIKMQEYQDNLFYKNDIFEKIGKAILNNQKMQTIYNDKVRVINPYKLINHLGIWYLLASENNCIKTFTFSKLKTIIFLDDYFTPDKNILQDIENQKNYFLSIRNYEAILEISGKAKEYFLCRKILANQNIIDNKDDKLIISTIVSYEDEILRLVWQYIPYIKILSPKHLVERNKQELNLYLKGL